MRLRFDRLVKTYPKSLITEFFRMFGPANTEKLLTVFAGTTIQVPSTKEQEEMERNIAIYETLSRSVTPGESRRLGEALSSQYDVSRKRIRKIYHDMRHLLRENKRFQDSDHATGKHQVKRIKVRRRTKWK